MHQRALQRFVDGRDVRFRCSFAICCRAMQAQRDVGIFSSIVGRAIERHAVKRDLFLARAADIFEVLSGVMVEIAFRKLIHAVIVLTGMT